MGALGAASSPGQVRLDAVRAWWGVRHPPPSLAQRLDLLYMTAMTVGVGGAIAYGTASSALAEVMTPRSLALFGPSLAMLAALATAHWGVYQGPVIFSVADVAHLLGAPLPRRGLAAKRLLIALAGGAIAGALAAGLVIVGLSGQGRGVGTVAAAGLTVGLAELGALAVTGAWAVQRSARWERTLRRATWVSVLVAAALVAVADAGQVGSRIALWSGPWGWAVQPGAGPDRVEWLAALAMLTLATAVAAAAAVRGAGRCPTERHLVRAEGRAGAMASLASFDARTARQALAAVGPQATERRAGGLDRLRAAIAARGARPATRLAIVWRDVLAATQAPGRVVEAAALTAAGTVLCLLNAERPVAVVGAMLLIYFGAARMLGPLRSEIDLPARARLLLRPRIGRVLLVHGLAPVLITTIASVIAAGGCAVAGALPVHGTATLLALITLPPLLTGCAAMSARRAGRMPQTLLVTAIAADPSGGGLAIASWAIYWPALGALIGAVPVLLIAGTGATAVAAAWIVIVTAALAYFLDRDPAS